MYAALSLCTMFGNGLNGEHARGPDRLPGRCTKRYAKVTHGSFVGKALELNELAAFPRRCADGHTKPVYLEVFEVS